MLLNVERGIWDIKIWVRKIITVILIFIMVVSQSVISSWAISNGESSSEEKVISDFLSNYDGNEKVQLRDIIESDIEALKELGCLQAATLNSINNQKHSYHYQRKSNSISYFFNCIKYSD